MHPVDSASEQTAQARNDLLSKRYATFAACTGFDLAQAFQDARLKAAGLPDSGKGHHFHEEYSDAEARGLIEWSAALLDPTGLRLQLKSQGYSPIPIRGKRPPMDEWQNLHVVTPEQIRNWAKDWSNAKSTGVLTK